MGKKVSLLLKDIPFSSWGQGGESTFRYPAMRLFLQKERDNLQEVLKRVSIKLRNEINTYN